VEVGSGVRVALAVGVGAGDRAEQAVRKTASRLKVQRRRAGE